MKKFLSVCIALVMAVGVISLPGCGESGKLAVTPAELEIEQYEEATLSVNKTGEVKWSSSDPMVVRVDDSGKITSVKMGSATVTATLGEESATCEVTVVRATKNRSLIVSADTLNLKLGVAGQDSATVTAELKEAGSALSGVTYTWTSTAPGVATVSNGTITAVGSGTATVTVSTKYREQAFAKEIAVTVRDWSNSAEGMEFLPEAGHEPAATLENYTGDVTALGFAEGEEVTAWVTEDAQGGYNKIMPAGALTEGKDNAYERMIFDMSVPAPLTGDIVFWMYEKTYTISAGVVPALGLDYGLIVFDRETGDIHTGALQANHVYTVVATLAQKPSDTVKAWGIGLFQAGTVYFSNVVCCNSDYYEDKYADLKKPNEPFAAPYFVYGDSLTKMTPDTDGWTKQTFAEGDLWNKRVYLGNEEWTVIYNYTAMKENYDYFGFELMFKTLGSGAFWTGGYSLGFTEKGVFTKEGGGEIAPGDIYIYDDAGKYVVGKPFEANKVYSVKIRIQKEPDGIYQNLSTGVGLNSGEVWVRNGYFLAQETPDPVPDPEPVEPEKTVLPGFAYGDKPTALTQKSTAEGFTDWYEQTFAAGDLWGKRVFGYDSNISFVKMREYDYYGFDIVFKDEFVSAILWNGGEGTIAVSGNKFNATAGDLFVYDEDGNDVTGEELRLGVKYTLKIKIYGVDSNTFGLGLNAPGTIYVANPYLV